MTRIPDLVVEGLSVEQRLVHDAIVEGPRGRVEGPLQVWLQSAQLASRAQELGAFCRFGTSLPPRLSELAILVIGAFWQAGFEWHVHAPIAAEAGLPQAAIEAIRIKAPPNFAQPDEAAVYNFATELVWGRSVSDASYQQAVSLLGLPGVVELTGILGYYGLISMTIVAFQVPVPNGNSDPFAAT